MDGSEKVGDEELCVTPVESVFDAFSPCEEEPQLSLFRRKKMAAPSIEFEPMRRQLNFDLCNQEEEEEEVMSVDSEKGGADENDDILEEERFVEIIYMSVFDAILCAQKLQIEEEEPKTPGLALHVFSDVPDSCPRAPLRHGLKSRNISSGICRKLQF